MKVALSIIGRVVGFFFLIFFAHRLWIAGEFVAASDPIGLMIGISIMVVLYAIDRIDSPQS